MLRIFLAACLLAATPTDPHAAIAASTWEGSTNALCRNLIDRRDYDLFEAGQKAAVAIVSAAIQSQALPDPVERPHLIDVLQRQRDALAATHQALALHSAQEPQLVAEWQLFLGTGAQEIDLLDRRIGALTSGHFQPHLLMRDAATGSRALEQALYALGFLGRDCELVFSSPGVPPAYAAFIKAAAGVCAEALDRRALRYRTQQDIVLQAMFARGKVDGDRAPIVSAAQALESEWLQTLKAFGAIETIDVPNGALWGAFLEHIKAMGEVYGARAAALESGDPDLLALAFSPTLVLPVAVEMLGLGQTDCRTLTF